MKLKDKLEIAEGDYGHFRLLEQYHYLKVRLTNYRHIFIIKPKFGYHHQLPTALCVIVYGTPLPHIRGRNKLLPNFYQEFDTAAKRMKFANTNISSLSRLITDPRFRRQGLAHRLFRESLQLQSKPLVEILAPIDFSTKLFLDLGFQHCYNPAPYYYRRFTNALEKAGVREKDYFFIDILVRRISQLPADEKKQFMYELDRFRGHFKHDRDLDHIKIKLQQSLNKLPYPNAYGLWSKQPGDPYRKVEPHCQPHPQ